MLSDSRVTRRKCFGQFYYNTTDLTDSRWIRIDMVIILAANQNDSTCINCDFSIRKTNTNTRLCFVVMSHSFAKTEASSWNNNFLRQRSPARGYALLESVHKTCAVPPWRRQTRCASQSPFSHWHDVVHRKNITYDNKYCHRNDLNVNVKKYSN